MKHNTKKDSRMNHKARSLNGAVHIGARIWGSFTAATRSGATYLLAPFVTGSSPALSDRFVDSQVVIPPAGRSGGIQMWRAGRNMKMIQIPYAGKKRKSQKRSLLNRKKAA